MNYMVKILKNPSLLLATACLNLEYKSLTNSLGQHDATAVAAYWMQAIQDKQPSHLVPYQSGSKTGSEVTVKMTVSWVMFPHATDEELPKTKRFKPTTPIYRKESVK